MFEILHKFKSLNIVLFYLINSSLPPKVSKIIKSHFCDIDNDKQEKPELKTNSSLVLDIVEVSTRIQDQVIRTHHDDRFMECLQNDSHFVGVWTVLEVPNHT